MEFDDAIKLLKFWRIFKNLKNFKSGGLRIKFKAIATVFALGFSGVSYLFLGEIGTKALELTPQDEPVMEACLDNHKRLNMSFEGRISNKAGCACTAKMVTATILPEDYNTWVKAHALLLHNYQEKWSVTTEAQAEVFEENKTQMYSALQDKSNMPAKRYSEMIDNLSKIDETCDTEATYDEHAIVKIAALRPIGYEAQLGVQNVETNPEGEVTQIKLRGAKAPIKTASK